MQTTSTTGAAPRPPLTRDRVIDAALSILDDQGLQGVTMRAVAREVGVEAMSLYNHVQDKDDLLDGICSAVMRDFRIPEDDSDTLETARHAAREWRRLLRAHPNVVSLFANRTRKVMDLDALAPMEFALATIERMGLHGRDQVMAFHVMGGYIMGFVVMEVGSMFSAGMGDDAGPSISEMAMSLPPGVLPHLVEAMPHMMECDPDEQFEFGLDLLLAGLQARAATARS
jgi:TetR/AcrR family tetracycline transcriptional repressor